MKLQQLITVALGIFLTFGTAFGAYRYQDDTEIPEWALESVYALKDAEVITGFGDGTFQPNTVINRAQALVILQRAMARSFDVDYDADIEAVGELPFSDVPEDAWFTNGVKIALNRGWIRGYPDGTFRPQATLNNAEWAVLLERAYAIEVLDEDPTHGFEDVPLGVWYADAVRGMKKFGLVRGVGRNFAPQSLVTRAEAAWTITKALNRPEFQQWYVDQEEERERQLRIKRMTAVKESDFNANKQGVPYVRKGLEVNALADIEVVEMKLGQDWTSVGSITLYNPYEELVQLDMLRMNLSFEDESINPAKQFQIQIELPPRGSSYSEDQLVRTQDIGNSGQVIFTGMDVLISPDATVVLPVNLRLDPSEELFFRGGAGELRLVLGESRRYGKGRPLYTLGVVFEDRLFTPIDFIHEEEVADDLTDSENEL